MEVGYNVSTCVYRKCVDAWPSFPLSFLLVRGPQWLSFSRSSMSVALRGPPWPSVATCILPARTQRPLVSGACQCPPRPAVQCPRPHGFVSPGFPPQQLSPVPMKHRTQVFPSPRTTYLPAPQTTFAVPSFALGRRRKQNGLRVVAVKNAEIWEGRRQVG